MNKVFVCKHCGSTDITFTETTVFPLNRGVDTESTTSTTYCNVCKKEISAVEVYVPDDFDTLHGVYDLKGNKLDELQRGMESLLGEYKTNGVSKTEALRDVRKLYP